MKAKNGISLIVLVITIVVVIILAAAVILSLGENNPINDARAANVANSQDNIGSAIVNLVGSRLGAHAVETSSTFTLLSDSTYGDPVLDTASYTGHLWDGVEGEEAGTWATDPTEITGLHRIGFDIPASGSDAEKAAAKTKNEKAWKALNLKEPTDGVWYYSVTSGKVYLELSNNTSRPKWSNKTTNLILIHDKTLDT